MTTPITLTPQLSPLAWPTPAAGLTAPSESGGFQDLLLRTWQDTQQLTGNSRAAVESSLIGDDLAMVETFTAMRESDIALRLMMQVRNKLIDAYQELQQMRF
jgi:flagellar hook-basal body complex protein FliE